MNIWHKDVYSYQLVECIQQVVVGLMQTHMDIIYHLQNIVLLMDIWHCLQVAMLLFQITTNLLAICQCTLLKKQYMVKKAHLVLQQRC